MAETLTQHVAPAAARDAWARALQTPALHDLPYTVETNAHGQLLLTVHKPAHSRLQSHLLRLLDQHAPDAGEAMVEFAVETAAGIKGPDVVWISDARYAQMPEGATACPVMPELCVEVVSAGNTAAELEAKRALYLDGGAQEVWICDESGRLRFFDADGPRPASALAPSMPARVAPSR